MAAVRTPHRGRTRHVSGSGAQMRTLQTLSRINPALSGADLNPLRGVINAIRPTTDPVQRGYYTVQDRLTRS